MRMHTPGVGVGMGVVVRDGRLFVCVCVCVWGGGGGGGGGEEHLLCGSYWVCASPMGHFLSPDSLAKGVFLAKLP